MAEVGVTVARGEVRVSDAVLLCNGEEAGEARGEEGDLGEGREEGK